MSADWPILSIVIWLPIIGGLLVLGSGDRAPNVSRWLALVVSIATFLLSLPLWTQFDSTTASMQFVEKVAWIPTYDIYYYLGIDGISMPLIILTTFITVLVVIAGWEVIQYKPSLYMAAFLVMEGVMVGVFAALDSMLFYVFWEAMLLPMFLIIGIWGGPRRVYATIKFFLYTFLGSVFMLVALIYMYFQADSMEILAFHDLGLGLTEQILIFVAFLLAFAVKVPMWPVHTWLPDAHVEAPTGGSVILAAIMLKMGGYGFVRLSLPIVPDGSAYFPVFPYPSYRLMSDADAGAIYDYLQTTPAHRQANREHDLAWWLGRWMMKPWQWWVLGEPAPAAPELERGRYLVDALGHCGECHTPRNWLGVSIRTRYLAGTDVGPDRNVHTDEARGTGQNGTDQEADGRRAGQEQPGCNEHDRAHDGDGGVLTVEICGSALADSASDLLHAGVACICRHDRLDGPDGVDDGQDTAAND